RRNDRHSLAQRNPTNPEKCPHRPNSSCRPICWQRGKKRNQYTQIINKKQPPAVLPHGFFGGVLTITPEPSFKVWIASTHKLSKRSVSPLGQRTCTGPVLVAAPRPKCTRMSFCEI